MESYKSEFIDFLPVHFLIDLVNALKCLILQALRAFFNLKGNYRKWCDLMKKCVVKCVVIRRKDTSNITSGSESLPRKI